MQPPYYTDTSKYTLLLWGYFQRLPKKQGPAPPSKCTSAQYLKVLIHRNGMPTRNGSSKYAARCPFPAVHISFSNGGALRGDHPKKGVPPLKLPVPNTEKNQHPGGGAKKGDQ